MWISPTNTMAPGCSTSGARSGSRSRSGWSQPDHGSTQCGKVTLRSPSLEIATMCQIRRSMFRGTCRARCSPRITATSTTQQEIDLYQRMLRETDPARQRALMRDFEKYVLDDQAHAVFLLWWYRIVPHR